MNFVLFEQCSYLDRVWEVEPEALKKRSSRVVLEAATGHQRFPQREICASVELEAEKGRKPIHYILVPNIEMNLDDK